jgi:hypothetical protein
MHPAATLWALCHHLKVAWTVLSSAVVANILRWECVCGRGQGCFGLCRLVLVVLLLHANSSCGMLTD